MPRYSIDIRKGSPLHQLLVKRLQSRVQMGLEEQETKHQKWREAEERTLAFMPESENDQLRRFRRINRGEPIYTTIQIPYSYGILMSAHTYWTSVFFARSPVHQFMGRHGEAEQQTQALEALIGYQTEVGEFLGPYYIWLYDAGKYGAGVIGEYWEQRKLHYGSLVEIQDPISGEMQVYQTTQEMVGYTGNSVFNVSIWDFIHDPRVPLKRFQDGEFCAYRCRIGWNRLVERMDAGYYVKEQVAQLRGKMPIDRTRGEVSDQLYRPQFDKQLYGYWGDAEGKHPAGFVGWEVYVTLVPSEWDLGKTTYPQKWCFTISEDYEIILGATPMGYVHCRYPFSVAEMEVEGYGLFTRGIPEIMLPIQNTVDWLINTHFYNVRASLNNQFIVDPSKLVIKDIKNSGPGFVWRLRPEAYGTDITKMFMQVPIQDITRSHLADFQTMLGIGERTLGVNDQIMGSLNTGSSRKTATEVRTTTGFGVNRQKTITEYMSATAFAPHAQRLVQNSQQFYDAQAKLRRVGNLALEAGQQFLNVSPDDIQGFFDFVPVDGTLPIDRMAQANLWKEMMGSLRMMPPQVAMQYDWVRIFAWVASLAGLKNISQFRVQMVPDQMLQQQAAQGNVVPLRPPQGGAGAAPSLAPVTPGNAASTAAGLNAMPGMGGEEPSFGPAY
jgi:hypothetical protein